MKVIVAGADGNIGSALAESLTNAGHEVLGTVFRRAPGKNELFLDLSRPATFRNLPAGPVDAVAHAAGLVDQSLPARLIRSVNALGTRRLVDWARRRGCGHFVFLSSVSVYGLFTMGQNRGERTPAWPLLAPLPYMRSKIAAERFVRQSGLPYTILRLPPVLGKGDTYLSPAVVSALLDGDFAFAGAGRRLVSVMTLAGLGPVARDLLAHGPLNAAYNCADRHVPWRELVDAYAASLGLPPPVQRESIFRLPSLLPDKPALLRLTFSLFGAHFPDEALHRALPHDHSGSWRDAVAEAAAGMRRENSL